MAQTPFVILALFFISIALAIIFFMAWRTFGRQKHVLTWAICFAMSACQWAFNLAYGWGLLTSFPVYWIGANILGAAVAYIAVAGYMQRARRHVYVMILSALTILTAGGSSWFALVQPHAGLQIGLLPLSAAFSALWAAWILFDVPRKRRPAEWGSIISYLLFAAAETAVGLVALSQGAEPDSQIGDLYELMLFLTLPTCFTLLGLFALLIVASDLAQKAQELARYQLEKKREELERSWGTLQDAIEAIPDLICIDDGRGNVVTCNEAFAHFLGREPEEFRGKRTMELLSLYRERFHSINNDRVETSEEIAQKFWHALTSGERLHVNTTDNLSYIVDCGYLRSGGQIMVARDVTQLHRTRTRLETAINAMPIGFSLFDRRHGLVACNRSFERFVGADEAWIEAQPLERLWSRVLRRLDAAKNETLVQRSTRLHGLMDAIEAKQLVSETLLLDDGCWYELTVQPAEDGGFVVIANDISARRLLELDREKSEAQLREILSAQPFPVLVARHPDYKVLFASRAATEALGLGDDGAPVRPDALFWESFGRTEDLQLASGDSGASLAEVTLSRADGEPFPALFSSHRITFAGDDVEVISFIDIADIKALQSELETQREALFQSEKLNALGTLLAGVAHELNNPLTVVVANAHVLAMKVEDEEVRGRLEKITDASDRCSKIIRSFLNMARKNPSKKVMFDLADCVEHALEIASYGLREHQIFVSADLTKGLPAVVGDPDQLAQVILNLIINAKQALIQQDAPREITVSTRLAESGDAVELHVVDNGPGIPDAIRDRIFEPFFTTKAVGEGTGMGLSLVRAIVHAQNGEFDLVTGAGPGAHFRVRLPHNGVVLTPDAEAILVDVAGGAEKSVLIVDDDANVLEALEDILKLQGHSVSTARSGAEALHILAERAFDVVLSDLRMPQMDGEQLLKAVEESFPQMAARVGFITGNNMSQQARRFLERSGRPSLGKPFLPQEVAELIEELHQGI